MKVVIAEPSGAESLRLVAAALSLSDTSVVSVARGSEVVRTTLDEEADVLVLGARFDSTRGLEVLHTVRPLLPALRIAVVGDHPSDQFRRAFLLGDIDLLVGGPDRLDVMSDLLRQWQCEKRDAGESHV